MTPIARREMFAIEAADSPIAAIQRGDLSGLGVLFDRHGDEVYRFLARLGIAASDIEDLVQQTFLDVLHAARGFHEDAAVRPWLFGIATMVARRHRRSVGRMLDRLRRWTEERVEDAPPTPAECFDVGVQGLRAQRALEALSPRTREAFVLVVLEGLSGDDAAAVLDIPIATVWTRVHHARRELRQALEDRE